MTARRFAQLLLDTVLPPRCLRCGLIVGTPRSLCPPCWNSLSFLGEPCCAVCGLPFVSEAEAGSRCGACLREPPGFARARAALVYDDESAPLILAFKHGDRTDLAPALARWMAGAGEALLRDAACLAPVPLHPWRLLRRRYNQAALLAHQLGALAGKAVVPDLLRRRRRTPSQGTMSRQERRRNVAGAFALEEGHRRRIAGRRILLIDDVLTTGATLEACAAVLSAAGAEAVDVLTLARVVRPVA